MYSIPTDVYVSYPEMSRTLPLVSKQLSGLSLRGSCNSLISNHELTEYITYQAFSKFGMITIYDNDDGYNSRIDLFVIDKFLGLVLQDEDWIDFDGTVSETPEFQINNIKRSDGDLDFPFDYIDYIKNDKEYSSIYPDISTVYQIFSKRRICSQYPNYEKQMTKEYLYHIVKELNNHKPSLYLYLICNIMILNMNINMRDTISLMRKRAGEDIGKYVERINEEMDNILDDINEYIDNL